MLAPSAAAVIVGNEVLSAKVDEQNGAYLIRALKGRSIPLAWMAVVPDDVDAIVEAIALARHKARWVFTSGGIGPTHDDVTVRAVALALGRPVVRMPEMERLVREHYRERATPAALRLADAPAGSQLLFLGKIWYPVLCCDGVYMLPGVPQLFRQQLDAVLVDLRGAPRALRSVFLDLSEPELAPSLDALALAMPDVAIGSYPTFGDAASYQVKVTVEHADAARVAAAVGQLLASLPANVVLRLEPSDSDL